MPGPLIAGPTLFALATGALIGAGVAALIYETELVEDIKQGIKQGIDAFVEKRRNREAAHPIREMVQTSSSKVAAPTPNTASRSPSSSQVSPFEDTFDDLYHTPSFSSSQRLHFGSSSETDEDSETNETRLTRRRGQRKTSNSQESLSSGSARVSKRFRAPVGAKIELFGNTTTALSTDEADTDSTATSDAGFTTPAASQSEYDATMLSTADSDSNFSDPVMVELTSEDEQSEMEPSSSVSTLKSRPVMTN